MDHSAGILKRVRGDVAFKTETRPADTGAPDSFAVLSPAWLQGDRCGTRVGTVNDAAGNGDAAQAMGTPIARLA